MDKRAAIIRNLDVGLECRARIKQAAGPEFAGIADVPMPGQRFSDAKLENDYAMKHPLIANLHPGVMGGIAGGIALKKYLGGKAIPAGTLGGAAGMGLEGAHRLGYMLSARKMLERGEDPRDGRYVL